MAGQFLKSLGEFFGGAATSGITNLVDSAVGAIDTFVTTPEDKLKAEKLKADIIFQAREQEFQSQKTFQDLKMAYLSDKQSARQMFAHDSSTQKILTLIFTVGYFAITAFMIIVVFKMIKETDLNDFVIAFISSIFGAFQSAMIMILSFYFGSSQGGENQSEKMAEAFKQASAPAQ